MAATATAAVSSAKGGFWIRTVAYVIDAIIVGFVSGIVNQILYSDATGLSGGNAVNLVLSLIYFGYFWSVQGGGQTLGMRIFNLKVVRTDGSMLTYSQTVVRFVGLIVSFLCLLIGVIWVAFDANKQGWHDKIAGTYVVKTA